MFNSFLLSISIFSQIPVKIIDYKKANMKYILLFFPFVGVIIGTLFALSYTVMNLLNFSNIMSYAILTSIPFIVTGGIHADGFMDTTDAIKSYGDKNKRLAILSDPHIGAFSVIYMCIYILLWFGFVSNLDSDEIFLFSKCFIVSRILSAYAGVSFKCAKKEGLLFEFNNSADVNFSKSGLIIMIIAVYLWMIIRNGLIGAITSIVSIIMIFIYKRFSYKVFDGITGDTEGWFLMINEIVMLGVISVLGGIL